MSKGSNVPTIGPVNISWYTGTLATAGPVSTSVSPENTSNNTPEARTTESARPRSPDHSTTQPSLSHEEEVIASGWGGDGDGEDGMGML